MDRIRWGILSTARIALNQVVPALQSAQHSVVEAIASRSQDKAEAAARRMKVGRAYGSYEALLDDPAIDAIYNPLPNHLHLPWSLAALEAGKHVLCEKPITLNAEQATALQSHSRRFPDLKIMEAFMYRHHLQWKRVVAMVRGGEIGELRTVESFFSYSNLDPADYRNQPQMGGGGLLDIGCYCVSVARLLFQDEPQRVNGMLELDPDFGIDRLASGLLVFAQGTSTFTCGTQMRGFQRVNILGSQGRIELGAPFNPPADKPAVFWHYGAQAARRIRVPSCNQYREMVEYLAQAILDDAPIQDGLDDALANMRVLDALRASAARGGKAPESSG